MVDISRMVRMDGWKKGRKEENCEGMKDVSKEMRNNGHNEGKTEWKMY